MDKEALECVRLGAEEMRKREKTVTFRKAVVAMWIYNLPFTVWRVCALRRKEI